MPIDNQRNNKSTENGLEVYCPKCNSDNVVKMNKTGYTIMVLIMFGLPLPFFKKKYYCYDCENEWKIEKNKKNAL